MIDAQVLEALLYAGLNAISMWFQKPLRYSSHSES